MQSNAIQYDRHPPPNQSSFGHRLKQEETLADVCLSHLVLHLHIMINDDSDDDGDDDNDDDDDNVDDNGGGDGHSGDDHNWR